MKQTIIVAVSGGADSMCLLNTLRLSRKYNLVVCHVDYHQRATSSYDKSVVTSYCEKYRIKCHILDVTEKPTGNFQAYARQRRYDFFKLYYDLYRAVYLAVGHHMDDLIETYLMQQRRSAFLLVGMKSVSNIYGMRVIRPLLEMTKDDILTYIVKHKIEFAQDESNFSDKYERNRLRMQLYTLSLDQKRRMAMQVMYLNKRIQKQLRLIKPMVKKDLEIKAYQMLSFKQKRYLVALWFQAYDKLESVTEKLILQIDDSIQQSGQKHISVSKSLNIIKSYDVLVFDDGVYQDYNHVISNYSALDTESFRIDTYDNGGIPFNINEHQFPITIRNWNTYDKVVFPYGTKKVSRVFIDQKVPKYLRSNWPIICDCHQNIVCVPGLIKNIVKNSDKTLYFMVK